MTGESLPSPLLPARAGEFPVLAIIAEAGAKASEQFLEFFAATIRNKNTRAAYVQAAAQFFRWCEDNGLRLTTARPLHVSAYIESKPLTAPSIKQHLAALRGLFNWLVIKQVVPDKPALFVKGPKFSRTVGVTPIMEAGYETLGKKLTPTHASSTNSRLRPITSFMGGNLYHQNPLCLLTIHWCS